VKPLLQALGIGKRFEGVEALRDVTVSIARGEIHALAGENGAGKSSLGKIVAGAMQPDSGTLELEGEPTVFRSPREALAAGIALVHQEIALAPRLSVLDNVFLGVEDVQGGLVRQRRQRRTFADLMDRIGFNLNPDALAGDLAVAEQQKVEIARAVARRARLIVLDEPTAALTPNESTRLLELIRTLREQGTTFVYISHHLQEVLDVADTVTVLKDGHLVATEPAAANSVDSLVTKMLGRSLETMFPDKRPPEVDAGVVLRVQGLTRAGAFEDVSFDVRAGEIVGLAGLVGSGRTEVVRAVFGADRYDDGTVEVDGSAAQLRGPRDAMRRGVAMLPESRKEQGLVMTGSVRDNLSLACLGSVTRAGFVYGRRERSMVESAAARVQLHMRDVDMPVAELSGGNQQKVVLGKWLLSDPKLLLADEPTRGVDVGARATIYDMLGTLAQQGMAILLISSELDEIMGAAHRILVMHRGRLVAQLEGDAPEDAILHAAFGRAGGVAA
jgi:ABC-type sugar transport system ATPase subunit